jgi:hypothetical protein
MPASLTHYEFYKQITKNPNSNGFIGAQGPDPFFFYGLGVSPNKKAKEFRAFGTYLHTVDPYITFKYLLEYIMGAKDEDKSILIDYTKGMLSHYILDKTCHPYIWYKSGFVTENDKDSKKYFNSHARIEGSIDVLIMDHFKDKTTTFDAVKFDKKSIKLITKMIYSLGKVAYKEPNIKLNTYKHALKNMHTVSKALYSKNGKKKAFIDKHFYNSPLSSMSEDKIENIKLDFLNLKHKEWRSCIDNKNPSKEDFLMLFVKAQKDYQKASVIFDNVLDGKTNILEIQKIFNGIDHNGFKLNSIKVYSDYIFK